MFKFCKIIPALMVHVYLSASEIEQANFVEFEH